MNKTISIRCSILAVILSCNNVRVPQETRIRFVTLDPGHFHAALVQKTMYINVDSAVYVYAPADTDLDLHLDRINAYNTRIENPTHWKEEVYTGSDFFEKMIAGKQEGMPGAALKNVVILSGNNLKKTEYILKSLQNGFNVFADKPMAIDSRGFELLMQAFEKAAENKLLLYDIMTERYEITTILQREFSMIPGIFGTLEKGTLDNPAITKESVHHFYKYVSGNVLTRPGWFFDVAQQGEGIVDVMTHLVDLVQWECFPEQVIDYTRDIRVNSARRWTTAISLDQFKTMTKLENFPSYLNRSAVGDTLKVSCNGEINYTVKGVHAKTSVIWNYQAPGESGDTHYSMMRGTRANLVIRQGAEEKYIPSLYIEPITISKEFEEALLLAIKKIQEKYPGIGISRSSKKWQVLIPEKLREGHEAHFARVTEKFLEYLEKGNMPEWEVPNMIAKYYTTTRGLETTTASSISFHERDVASGNKINKPITLPARMKKI